MKNEPVLSVLARLVREGLGPEDGDFEKDLYQLYKLAPEKYIGMLVQQERDELEEKQKQQILELKRRVKDLTAKYESQCEANLRVVDELMKLESVTESGGKVMQLLERLMNDEDKDSPGPHPEHQEAAQADPGSDPE